MKDFQLRLPAGYPSLGAFLRGRRLRNDPFLSQQKLADMCGLSRETVCLIEKGRWPSDDSLTAILTALDIDLSEIASESIESNASQDKLTDQREKIGRDLKAGRQKEALSLRRLSEITGISHSQLSRIELSRCVLGKWIEVRFPDGNREFDDDAVFYFTHPVLLYLADIGDPNYGLLPTYFR